MRSGWVLAGLAMMGCGPQRDQPPAGAFLDVRINATAVSVFHHLELYYGDGFMDPRPIATPAIVAGSEPPAEDATSWGGGHVVWIDHGQNYRYTKWQLTGFSHPIYIGVAAVDRSGNALAGGSNGPIDGPHPPRDPDRARSRAAPRAVGESERGREVLPAEHGAHHVLRDARGRPRL